MKKILILEGSPRPNGNSCILSNEFARGAEEAGNRVEKIRLSRKKLSGCLGCNACCRSGGACVQKDDMEEIRAKMLEADVIVLASLRGFTCCVPDAREGGVVLGVGAMEAGDIRSSDAMQQAWQMGKNV